MNIRKFFIFLMTMASLAIASAPLQAGEGELALSEGKHLLKVTDIKISRGAQDLLVTFDIDPRMVNPGRDREVIFTPVLRAVSGDGSVSLPAIRISGRNRYYSHLRNHDLEEGEKSWAAGSKEIIHYSQAIPFEDWMEKSVLDVMQQTANCCRPVTPAGFTPVARLDFGIPEYVPEVKYVQLTGDTAIELEDEGRAFIDFKVNLTEFEERYRKNEKELKKIIESIKKVKDDPDATITKITIKGYASPEGSYSNNVRLAMGRTQRLKEYVRSKLEFDPEIMMTDYEPEDWGGLRRWLLECDLPHRDEILSIVDSSLEPDPKNAEIERRFPKEYKLILDSVYPGLRHSDYTVRYRIRTYVDIEELKRVFRDTPNRLRPVDFQRIAATFETGSPEYDEVYLKAVEIHPDDPKSNLNAAVIAMKRKDLTKADSYLAKGGDSAEAFFVRGQLARMNGDLDRAENLMRRASELGLEDAAQELERIQEQRRIGSVEYLIEPTPRK